MFIFDLLKNQQQRVRVVAAAIAAGLVVLLGGLWFVQIVSAKHFEQDLQKQSFRTVRVSAIRGRILDRNGQPLAQNRPHYNAVVYLEDLRDQFDHELLQLTHAYVQEHSDLLSAKHKITNSAVKTQLQLQADYRVVSNLTWGVGALLQEPRALDATHFLRQSRSFPYVPYQIVPNLAPKQVAIFAEQLSGQPALELETQPVRNYPHNTAAAHLLGYVRRKDSFEEGEFSCDYRLPDYQGEAGVEGAFDSTLRGQPGIKSVLVNNHGYRQREETVTPGEGGEDICLTIDLAVQQAAEKALGEAIFNTRGGAAVVMDVRNGDILALASVPTFDPNEFITGISDSEWQRLTDEEHRPLLNRAINGAYPPGSTFKIITAIACLETGVLDPNEVFNSPGRFTEPGYHPVDDTAAAGPYNFERAFYRSSNTYFIHYGLKAGLRKLLEVAKRFHLGEKTQIGIHPERAGNVPGPEDAGRVLHESSTPDVCIGQEIVVSPLQMAVMTAAIANGGTLFWPRLISHSVSPDSGQQKEITAAGRVRDRVTLDPRHLEIIRQAMLADTEHGTPGDLGSGYEAFHTAGREPDLGNFRVAGKTGTAQVESLGKVKYDDTWFVSYGPYENPRYAVVVMIDHGASGGKSCAPVARKIYESLIQSEQAPANRPGTLADSGTR
jgi:penicillin-binding protein 2